MAKHIDLKLDVESNLRGLGALSRVGVHLSRWDMFRIKVCLWLRKINWAQKIILSAIEKNDGRA